MFGDKIRVLKSQNSPFTHCFSRIGHKNVMPGENLMTTRRPLPQPQTAPIHVVVPEEEIDVPIEISRSKPQPNIENTVVVSFQEVRTYQI